MPITRKKRNSWQLGKEFDQLPCLEFSKMEDGVANVSLHFIALDHLEWQLMNHSMRIWDSLLLCIHGLLWYRNNHSPLWLPFFSPYPSRSDNFHFPSPILYLSLNFRFCTLSLALRIKLLNCWIPHDIRHTVFTSICGSIRIIRQTIIKVTDLSKLLRNGFCRWHSIFMWKIHTSSTLPPSCGKPTWSCLVQLTMARLRTILTAKYYNERRNVFRL